MTDPMIDTTAEHDRCQALLAWYGNGSLNESETELCDIHLKGCAQCRGDLQETIVQMQQLNAKPVPAFDADAGLQSLLRQASARQTKPAADTQRYSPWPAALAASLVLSVGMLATWVTPTPGFQLLTEQTQQTGHFVQLAFHPGTSEEDIRQFIRGSGGTVEGNPTAAGIYRLRFQSTVSAEQFARLRDHPTIAWANTEL